MLRHLQVLVNGEQNDATQVASKEQFMVHYYSYALEMIHQQTYVLSIVADDVILNTPVNLTRRLSPT